MVAVSGKPLDLARIDARFKGIDKLIEQIMRQVSRQPRIPAPTSGGIVGVTRCEALDFTKQTFGALSSLGPSSWAVSTIYGESAGASSEGGSLPGIVLAAEGWYSLNASWIMSWETALAPAEFSCNAEPSFNPEAGFYAPEVRSAPTPFGSAIMQVAVWIAHGPFYAPAGGVLTLNAGWSNGNGYNQARAHIDVCRYA